MNCYINSKLTEYIVISAIIVISNDLFLCFIQYFYKSTKQKLKINQKKINLKKINSIFFRFSFIRQN